MALSLDHRVAHGCPLACNEIFDRFVPIVGAAVMMRKFRCDFACAFAVAHSPRALRSCDVTRYGARRASVCRARRHTMRDESENSKQQCRQAIRFVHARSRTVRGATSVRVGFDRSGDVRVPRQLPPLRTPRRRRSRLRVLAVRQDRAAQGCARSSGGCRAALRSC